jgi:hypothetical protein
VRWEEYVGGRERRLDAGRGVRSVAADGRHLVHALQEVDQRARGSRGGRGRARGCSQLRDHCQAVPSIRVWSRSTLELQRTLSGHTEGSSEGVIALLFVGGLRISGSDDSTIRARGVRTLLQGNAKACWRAILTG